ncbi:uncharacterized protein BO80DRAFT_420688 [Aspergillus ibericus CBS 121593]|uniref:Uncharacterized protein n=1 Tax=Aspergillus ibericus CBS 121593 TaxID=1448316 RepID=A0A395HET7_9EURO|nr:hypothetical protein BO80DRAFT_420688 [Aspergillus ibericus CBS 121593]RAL06392.1 hypothetical protein BO80DRAFT_420688 [Aspergillus ibericus CBS 121593]
MVTRSMTFREEDHTIYLEDLDIYIHDFPRKKARYAPSVHSLCKTGGGADLPSPHAIYNFGLAMIPLIWTKLPREIYKSNTLFEAADSLLATSRGREYKGSLWELLDRCRRLPVELSLFIWDFLPSSPVRHLLALNAARRIWLDTPLSAGGATISLQGDIMIYLTQLMKDRCVCGIRQGHSLYGHESSLLINVQRPAASTACVFTMGLYGLQNVEFMAETEESLTSGVDSGGSKFIIVIPCKQEMPLHVDVKWDVWKIYLISSHDKSIFGHDFFWVPPVSCGQLCWLSPNSFYNWPRHFDFTTQSQRFMTYVPLKRDERLYGLTAFCSSEGFVGLGTHFCSYSHQESYTQNSSVYWYGKQHGCPIHVQLDGSDAISSIYVYWHKNDSLSGSYFAITTIKNESFILGPQFPPSRTVMKKIYSSDDGEILGLYYDKSPSITRMTSLGIISCPKKLSIDSDHLASPLLSNHECIYYLNTSPFTSFSSQASLKDIERIEACYVDSRCTGMLLHYNNGRRRILGQWYESTYIQTDIQAISLPKNASLRFLLTRKGHRQLVTHVSALACAAPGGREAKFIDIAYGDVMVWMFSGNSDAILCLPNSAHYREE